MSIYCNTGVDFFFSVFVTTLNSPLDFNTSGFFFPLKAKLISAKLEEFFLSILKLWRFRKPRYIFFIQQKNLDSFLSIFSNSEVFVSLWPSCSHSFCPRRTFTASHPPPPTPPLRHRRPITSSYFCLHICCNDVSETAARASGRRSAATRGGFA